MFGVLHRGTKRECYFPGIAPYNSRTEDRFKCAFDKLEPKTAIVQPSKYFNSGEGRPTNSLTALLSVSVAKYESYPLACCSSSRSFLALRGKQ